MRCKVNFVQHVKTIMYLRRLRSHLSPHLNRHCFPLSAVTYVQKELDSARQWHIIIFTTGIRDRGDPASAQR
jgi:hypothetical protein